MSSDLTGRLILLAALGAACLLSQTNSARLEGTVQDPTGAVIAGAKVAAIHVSTQIRSEVASTADGHYIFPSVQPGEYTVAVEAPGFRRATVTGVTLTVAQTVTQ